MLIPSPGAQTKHNEMKGDTPMKKMLALILTMSLVFALLTACGGDQSGNQPNSENTGNPTTSQSGGSENSSTDFSEKVNLTFAIGGAAGQGTAIALQNAIDMISERSNGCLLYTSVKNIGQSMSSAQNSGQIFCFLIGFCLSLIHISLGNGTGS